MSVHIRPAELSELTELIVIEAAADGLFPSGRVTPGDTLSIADHEAFLSDGLLLVATVDQLVTGFTACKFRGPTLHLSALAVHPSQTKRGIGTRLLHAVIAEARRRGLGGVTLTTFEDLPFNAPFYNKLGFRTLPVGGLDNTLKQTLALERAAGMTRRVAMRLDLADSDSAR